MDSRGRNRRKAWEEGSLGLKDGLGGMRLRRGIGAGVGFRKAISFNKEKNLYQYHI